MKLTLFHILAAVLVIVSCVSTVVLYDRMPDPVPTHWNLRGEANGFTPKPWGAWISPIILVFMWGLFTVLPRISPKETSIERFGDVYRIISMATMVFIFLATSLSSVAAAGAPVDIGRVILVLVGALLAILGNYMGKVTRNFFVGIRTPWTLSNDEVWLRTHRLAGKLLAGGGVIIALLGLAGVGYGMAIAIVLIAALLPVPYSYVVYKRLEH